MRAPEWLYSAGTGSTLNRRDICGLLGITGTCLDMRIRRGTFPEADNTVVGIGSATAGLHLGVRQWKVKTVIKYFENLPKP